MPTQVDYSERGIWENIFDPGAWRNLLGGVSTITTGVGSVWEQIERIEGSRPLTPSPSPAPSPPPYNPNLGLRDFAFTPNVTLFIFGGAVLLIALALRKK